ncbi:MAG: nucleoside-diphosphate kinase [Planctomycetes bacterium RBG_16_64_10]|nr:MAG: nucleoside-diphosphate kinase [Planctomycetes bacterium RBG_16_64_10]
MEQTLILLKPDCLQRRLVGRILSRIEDKGLNLIAMKMLRLTPALARRHYAAHIGKPFYPALEAFITGGPVVAAVVQGPDATRVVRTIVGPTSGLQAPAGTIRGDFGTSQQMNLIHAADDPEAARREIDLFFAAAAICPYQPAIAAWLRGAGE